MNNIITESVLLRTLTRKSTLWFGKHEGLKIQQILDLYKNSYLRWVYYNFQNITFTDDILEEITINGKRKITKPGIAPEMLDKIFDENIKNLHIFTKNHIKKITKTRAQCKLIRVCISVNFKKSQLQSINQGRM